MVHALHSALWKGQIKGAPESGEHPLLLLCGLLSHIYPHLSYFSDLFWILLGSSMCYLIFFPVITTFTCLIQCQKEATKKKKKERKILLLFSQDGKLKPFMSLNLKSRADHLKSDLRIWIYFSALHLGHSYFSFIIHIQYTHIHRYASCTQRLCSRINQY